MAELTYWPKRAFFLLLSILNGLILNFIYRGKKNAVPPIQNELLLKSANQLVKEIIGKKLKSEDVVQAYIDRIREVEPYINAVVEDNFRGALEEARKVDALIESGDFSSEQLSRDKPLLGVPFTVKCLLKVKGFRITGASLIFEDRVADEDAPTVKLMKEAGAILLAVTNSAEFGGSMETVNLIYGRTSNPYDISRTCGGSSGGEAALIASCGSIIGIGNDCLGSIRTPSHFCGVFGHKCSRDLISNEGIFIKNHPIINHLLCTGPICRYSEDLYTTVKVLSNNSEEINLKKQVDFKDLKIYFLTQIENAWVLNTDDEIAQAVKKAASYFKEKYDTEVSEIKIPQWSNITSIWIHLYSSRVSNLTEVITAGKVKHLNGFIELIKVLFGKCQFTFATILALCYRLHMFFYDKDLIFVRESMLRELQKDLNNLLDERSLLLCPTLPATAPHHTGTHFFVPSTCYASIFNVLGLPATQCPMGLSRDGLPLGIQIASSKGNDSLALVVAAELEKAFGGWIPPWKLK